MILFLHSLTVKLKAHVSVCALMCVCVCRCAHGCVQVCECACVLVRDRGERRRKKFALSFRFRPLGIFFFISSKVLLQKFRQKISSSRLGMKYNLRPSAVANGS